jgi:membrane protease YdiL (CAAX protease family)
VQWDPSPIETTTAPAPGLPGVMTAFVGYGVAVGLAIAVVGVLVALDRPGGRTAALVLSEIGLWGGLVGACVVVSRRRGTGSVIRDFDYRFRWIDLGFGLAGAVAGRLVSAAFVAPLPVASRRLRDVDKSVLGDATHGAWAWVALIVITCVGAPLVEELFFRGLLQTRLVGRFGVVPGIAGASLLFGAAHLINWQGPSTFAYAWAVAGGGLVLGTMRHLTGRLGPGVIAHAIFNALAVLAVALLSHYG